MEFEEAAEILGVDKDCADEALLRQAFKKQSLIHYPDRNLGCVLPGSPPCRGESRIGRRARARPSRESMPRT